jgi:tRNA (pseudouridine54-N1)-methyltransferase
MRRFVVLAHETPADPASLSLEDLPGFGRVDVVCRCVTAGLLRSHGVREDASVSLVVDGYVVRFDGDEIRRLNPDERSTAALVRTALEARDGAIGAQAAEPAPGVSVRRGGLERLLEGLPEGTTLVELHDEGRPVAKVDPPERPVLVLSDHRPFTDREATLLADRADERLSVGPVTLHADQTVTVAHNWLDTDGYRRY